MLEIWIRTKSWNGISEELVGRVPQETGDYVIEETGQAVRVDLQGISNRRHGHRLAFVAVDGIGNFDYYIGRKTASGAVSIDYSHEAIVKFTDPTIVRPSRIPPKGRPQLLGG